MLAGVHGLSSQGSTSFFSVVKCLLFFGVHNSAVATVLILSIHIMDLDHNAMDGVKDSDGNVIRENDDSED